MAFSYDIAEAVEMYLINKEWDYDFDAEAGRFELIVELRCRLSYSTVYIVVKEDCFLCYAAFGAVIDEERRGAAAEFVARANYGLQNGSFELDMDDGMVQYKTFVSCKGGVPDIESVNDSIAVPVTMLDMYGDALTAVAFGKMPPKAAAEAAENGDSVDLKDLDGMIAEYARSAADVGQPQSEI